MSNVDSLPEYQVWAQMRQRCSNPNHKQYSKYGGVGITVCEPWGSFENFIYDVGWKPSPEYVLRRVDTTQGFNPGNCLWAKRSERPRVKKEACNNTSGKTGVYFSKPHAKWTAWISVKRVKKSLGYFSDFSEAIKARRDAECLLAVKEMS